MAYTASSLNSLSNADISKLSAQDIANLLNQQSLAGVILNIGGRGCWRVDQFQALSGAALGGLTADNWTTLAKTGNFAVSAINGLSNDAISRLTKDTVNNMLCQSNLLTVMMNIGGNNCWRVDQFDALSAAALEKIAISSWKILNDSSRGTQAINQLSQDTIKSLSQQTLKNILTQGKLTSVILNIGGYGCWRTDQFQALSADAFAALTTTQLSSLSSNCCKAITGAQISKLSTDQISALKYFDWLSPDAFAGLTSTQISSVSTAGTKGGSWKYMTAAQIGKLSADAFAGFTSTQLSSLSSDCCKAITGAQINKLSTDQIKALNNLNWISADTFAKLSLEALVKLSSAQLMPNFLYVGAGDLTGLWPDQVRQLSGVQISQMSDKQVQSLNSMGFGSKQFDSYTLGSILNRALLDARDNQNHTVIGVLTNQQLQEVAGNSVASSLIQTIANDALWIHQNKPAIVTSSMDTSNVLSVYAQLHG